MSMSPYHSKHIHVIRFTLHLPPYTKRCLHKTAFSFKTLLLNNVKISRSHSLCGGDFIEKLIKMLCKSSRRLSLGKFRRTQRLRMKSRGCYSLYFENPAEILHYLANEVPPLISMDNPWTSKSTDKLFSKSMSNGYCIYGS
ncbi:uncharacterized protein LOC114881151 [Osmia bicornis bicornis]|uniref:uncharacterized protein LOC114881151 n=1 Tax=Osmia bicornis bicornis TaxID=1437191 RepID=UPI001EAF6491|nr:uncharacterized protein LOC114881151 [Osmia bicornis bicornis]XP_046142289.1 uncharacterized protein LOC114881151 [Osmia bicornis bicornis]